MTTLSIDSLFLILGLLLVLSAFFSGSETALMSVNRYKLKHRVKKKDDSALKVNYLLNNPDKTLGLILLLNNFVNILASAITTLIAIELYGDRGVAIAAGFLTFIILVFSSPVWKFFSKDIISPFGSLANIFPVSFILSTVNDTTEIESHDGIVWEFQKDDIPYKNRLIMKSARFGRIHAVQYDTITNTIIGAADPDWEGSVKTY